MYVDWTDAVRVRFFTHLRETANVVEAARLTGVSRQRAYQLRQTDLQFGEAWETALRHANRKLEIEARRRALEAMDEPMLRHGLVVAEADGTPFTVRRYNDRQLSYLLTSIRRRRAAERREMDRAFRAHVRRKTREQERQRRLADD